jgi:hypothetical protein
MERVIFDGIVAEHHIEIYEEVIESPRDGFVEYYRGVKGCRIDDAPVTREALMGLLQSVARTDLIKHLDIV